MNGRAVALPAVRWLAAGALACAPALRAQYSPYVPPLPPPSTTQQPSAQQPSTTLPMDLYGQEQRLQQMGTSMYRGRNPFDPIWTPLPTGPAFQGFPTFAARLPGYGTYPTVGGAQGVVPLLPPAAEEDPGWPGWVRLRQREPLPFASDVGLLVRHSDRVWSRATKEDAFVPLYHHDKLRTLGVGSEVQVRQAGEFEVLLHDSTRLIARGPTDLEFVTLSPTAVVIVVRTFTWLHLRVAGREHTISLPDGSDLLVRDDPEATADVGQAFVLLRRADEPKRYGGRATMFNGGGRDVIWRHAFGETTLPGSHVLTMFLSAPEAVVPAPVVTKAAQSEPEGEALRFTSAAADARVSWCGASFDLGAGRSVRLDPVQGRVFTVPPAAGTSRP
jgi:hypothetical protein